MDIVALDAETFFSVDYTLSKMTTEAYVRDPRFECFGFGARWPHGGYSWIDGSNKDWLKSACDWSNTAVLCHHAHFDGLILAHHFGVKPAFWFDTLSMARLQLGNHVRVGLDKLAHHFKLDPKTVPYDLMRGRHWNECPKGFSGDAWFPMSAEIKRQVIDGCIHDLELTWAIFEKLLDGFPREELAIIDTTVRMFTEPKLIGDTALLDKIRDDEALRKNEKLYALGVGERDLMSADKFAALLEAEGVDIVYKDGKNGPIPAFAKTDQFMKDLLEDDNDRVADLALARTEVRSTIDETRAGRLAGMSRRGPLSIYLSYCAAHTRRWGGGDSINAQNLRRGSDLRRSLRAPDGYLFAAVDQSQGECRLLNWFAGQEDVLERFRRGEDPYLPMASAYYRRAITKADVNERQVGKVAELQLGFGSGGAKIERAAANGKPPVYLKPGEGEDLKNLYRHTHQHVEALWGVGRNVLSKLKAGVEFEWGPGNLLHGEKGRLYHPNGLWLDYTQLEWRSSEQEWRLRTRDGWVKTYGAKLVENVIQWLSRIVTSQAMLRVREAGYPIVGMAHDDLWVLIPDDKQPDRHSRFLIDCMAVTPEWAPGLPLGAECKLGQSYT